MYAVSKGNYAVADFLFKDGRCDPTIIANDGKTAINIATDKKHERIVELFLSDERVVNAQKKDDGGGPSSSAPLHPRRY